MGFKMLDMLSLGPVLAVGFGYFLLKRHDRLETERLSTKPLSPISTTTGDKELDAILGIAAALPVVKPTSAS